MKKYCIICLLFMSVCFSGIYAFSQDIELATDVETENRFSLKNVISNLVKTTGIYQFIKGSGEEGEEVSFHIELEEDNVKTVQGWKKLIMILIGALLVFLAIS